MPRARHSWIWVIAAFGMTMEESAARTAERIWTYARVWLRKEIRKPI